MNFLRKHYHWVIATLAFLEMIVFGGILNSASVFIIPITESLGVTRGSYALAMMPYSVVGTIGTMLSGLFYHRLGYKRSLILGLGITAASLVVTATCQTLTGFCISKFLLGLGYSVCFTAGAVLIVKNWFFTHQGLVIGAVSMSSGLGGSLMTLILSWLIDSFGWRFANAFLAVVCGMIALLYVLLMYNRPEDMGLQPFGYGTLSKKAKIAPSSEVHWPGLTFQAWLRRPLLYLMTLLTLISCTTILLCSGVILPHFQDQGFSPAEAAGFQSFYMLCLAIAKLLSGAVTDKIGAKPVSIFCLACGAAGQFLLSGTVNPALCYLGLLLCGIGLTMTSSMISLLASSLFGYRGITGINSIVLAMSSLGNIFASPIANLAFDRFGTYTTVFRAAALVTGGVTIVYLYMFVLDKKEKARLGPMT